jgi:hypothetical protein
MVALRTVMEPTTVAPYCPLFVLVATATPMTTFMTSCLKADVKWQLTNLQFTFIAAKISLKT